MKFASSCTWTLEEPRADFPTSLRDAPEIKAETERVSPRISRRADDFSDAIWEFPKTRGALSGVLVRILLVKVLY